MSSKTPNKKEYSILKIAANISLCLMVEAATIKLGACIISAALGLVIIRLVIDTIEEYYNGLL